MTQADTRKVIFAEAIKRAGAEIDAWSHARALRRSMLMIVLQRLEERRGATVH